MPPHAQAAGSWGDAVRRATEVTAARNIGGMDETCWDDVAMRNIIAMVLYALHRHDGQPVESISWNAVLWQLRDDQCVDTLVNAVLPEAGHDLSRTAAPGDPVAETWRWLTRTWNPGAPTRGSLAVPTGLSLRPGSGWVPDAPEPRWGGMSRGIGSGLPDPALEVCVGWAAGVVQSAIIAQGGGYRTHERVEVTDGPLAGHRGYVRESGWVFDDAARMVEGPAGYVVDFDDVEGVERINADQLVRSRDLRWPHRPEGTLKDGPPAGLHDPLPPRRTCGQDLEEILGRAANPEIVPEQLRRKITSAREHHHLELETQATPAPQRFSWRVIMHWYQLGEAYAEDQRADLYEVVVTRHLHDPEPVRYLALHEGEVPDLIAQCTAATE